MPMRKSVYGVHPAVGMVQKTMASLRSKTGRSLEEWIAVVKQSGPESEKDRREWLKEQHRLPTQSAVWIAERAGGSGADFDGPEEYLVAAERYVDEMFGGKRAALRPLYEELLKLGFAMGKDVKACPCTTMVPLYRNHVFAQIKPATQTRIDLGFALGARKPEGRLIDTGGYVKKDRITHRIPIESAKDIDAEVKRWLKAAYEGDVK
jgi:Domain of unknown function (DUF5655)/Domain of unknown function (DUF4287)